MDLLVGLSVGPVVAGVIGVSMPQYDLWGNTVNVASRMYSTGIENEIQMTEEVSIVLKSKGFAVKERGKVQVKGKGVMVTFLLDTKSSMTSGGIMGWLRDSLRISTGSTGQKDSQTINSTTTTPSAELPRPTNSKTTTPAMDLSRPSNSKTTTHSVGPPRPTNSNTTISAKDTPQSTNSNTTTSGTDTPGSTNSKITTGLSQPFNSNTTTPALEPPRPTNSNTTTSLPPADSEGNGNRPSKTFK